LNLNISLYVNKHTGCSASSEAKRTWLASWKVLEVVWLYFRAINPYFGFKKENIGPRFLRNTISNTEYLHQQKKGKTIVPPNFQRIPSSKNLE
jgi:hypothetical protein